MVKINLTQFKIIYQPADTSFDLSQFFKADELEQPEGAVMPQPDPGMQWDSFQLLSHHADEALQVPTESVKRSRVLTSFQTTPACD